jgi:hypothetical protein
MCICGPDIYLSIQGEIPMKFVKTLILSLATLMFVSTLALAGGGDGTVTKVDEKGMATVKLADGKEVMGVSVMGAKAGDKVDCMEKDGKMSCMKKH